MKKLLVFLLVPFFGFAQVQTIGFTVKGNLTGLADNAEITLSTLNGNTIASAKAAKGVFSLKGRLPGTDIVKLGVAGGQQFVEIMMNNENVTVTGNWNDINAVSVTGAAAQADFDVFKKSVYPYLGQRNSQIAAMNAERDMAKKSAAMAEIQRIDVVVANVVMQLAKDKPASPASAWGLYFAHPLFQNRIPELDEAYAKLQSPAKKLVYANELERFLAKSKVGMVGSQAMDFTQNDVNDKPLSLSSFKGKYVLVDFWASWCGPCRGENPNVVSAYERYKDKNFTVLGVSLDRAKPSWLQAIKEDGLNWPQVSDLQYWSNAVAKLYNIESIPANLLIDPTGKIVAKNIRGEELHRTLAELLK